MSFSDSLENDVLNYFFSGSSVTRPTAWYVGLHLSSSSPGETGTGGELTIGTDGYSRREVTSWTISGDQASNANAIEFLTATGDWGTIGYVSIWTLSSSGTMLAYAALASNKTVSNGDVLRIPVGDLDINME